MTPRTPKVLTPLQHLDHVVDVLGKMPRQDFGTLTGSASHAKRVSVERINTDRAINEIVDREMAKNK